ncbi:MAG TPA: hypothetical protein PKE55_08485 [Kiritimatiellia bacterium]|nr:hypothetical protein [Kiritimatiellia bacterium]
MSLKTNVSALLAISFVSMASSQAQHVGGSPFYEFELVAQPNDPVFGGTANQYPLQFAWREVAINDHGRVAFGGELTDGAGEIAQVLLADVPGGGLRWLNQAIWKTNTATFLPLYQAHINQDNRATAVQFRQHLCTPNCGWDPTCDNQYPGGLIKVFDAALGGGEFRVINGVGVELPGAEPVHVIHPTVGNASHPFIFSYPALAPDGDVFFLAHETEPCGMVYTNTLNRSPGGEDHARIIQRNVDQWNPPMAASNQVVVMREGSHDDGQILLYRPGTSAVVLATTPAAAHLHYAPSITPDGQVVAFIGQTPDGVEGIYLVVFDAEGELIAGSTPVITSTSIVAFAANGDPITLGGFGADIENPYQQGIDPARRLPVIRHARNDDGDMEGDSIILAFIATPSQASAPNPVTGQPLLFSNQEGIWTLRVDVERTLGHPHEWVLNPRGVLPVIQKGNLIEGAPITGLHLWLGLGRGITHPDGTARETVSGRPMMGDHVLAFAADTGAGRRIVRAVYFDTDGDGLPDHWERPGGGIDMTRNGTPDLVLADWGADPLRYDLFLEVDFSRPRTTGAHRRWNNRPDPGVFRRLADLFAAAPIANPDATTGITLHVDAGPLIDPESDMPYSVSTGSGNLQGGDLFGMASSSLRVDMVYFGMPTNDVNLSGFRSRSFHSIKHSLFGSTDSFARELAFRYALFADFHSPRYVGSVAGANAWTIFPTEAIADTDYDSTVVITAGTGAGQLRRINRDVSTEDQLVVQHRWTTIPNESSEFTILNSSAGLGEVFFFPSNNYHSVPGNDFLISLGGWSANNNGTLMNPNILLNTLAHELGHTLGLRHGGTDHCAFKGTIYQSVMSYSYSGRGSASAPIQFGGCEPTGALSNLPVVQTFSDAFDLTFDDWSYIRPEPYGLLSMVGNTFDMARDGIPYTEPTYGQFLEWYGPPDLISPLVEYVTPTSRFQVAFGGTLEVTLRVTDDVAVEQVLVEFDIDGDGATTGALESVEATYLGEDLYTASFSNVGGSSTQRVLRVIATDTAGNSTHHRPFVRVGPGAFPSSFGPSISISAPQFNETHIIGGDLVVSLSASSFLEVDHVVIGFDVNGDGVITGAQEVIRAARMDSNIFEVDFQDISGPSGTRQIVVQAYDRWLNRQTQTRQVAIVPFTTTPPVITQITPVSGTVVPLKTNLVVTLTATSDLTNLTATARFDRLGSGSPVTSTMTPMGGGVFQSTFASVSGAEGLRPVMFTVTDPLVNVSTNIIWVEVVDTTPPVISMTAPVPGALIHLGSTMTNLLTVTDDQSVAGVQVSFDRDGDGSVTGSGETIAATLISGSNYRAVFAGLSGPEGPRTITATAWDPSGKTTTASRIVHLVNGGLIKSPVDGQTLSPGGTLDVWFEAASGLAVQEVRISFDRDGDGSFDGPGEWMVAQTGIVARTYVASFANLHGVSGVRTALVEIVDVHANVITTSVVVVFGEFTGHDGPASERLGSVPMLPERLATGGIAASGPNRLVCIDDLLYFVPRDRESSDELWRSDGTVQGTFLLRDINRWWDAAPASGGNPYTLSSGITNMVAFDGRLFFYAQDNAYSVFLNPQPTNFIGSELWVTDGTTEGTELFKDIIPGRASGSPRHMTVFNDRIFFSATDRDFNVNGAPADGPYGRELWWSDGTEEGTEFFLDLNPGTIDSNPRHFTVANTQMFFAATLRTNHTLGSVGDNVVLWVTDGTGGGTHNLAQFYTPSPVVDMFGSEWVAVGDTVFFPLNNSAGSGQELWASDGTTGGTRMVRDIRPGSSSSLVQQLTPLGDLLIFTAEDGVHGREIWVSDGTEAGTFMLLDIQPGSGSSNPDWLTVYDGHVYFAATAPVLGRELWRTDGTVEGTEPAFIIAPHIGASGGPNPYPSSFADPAHLGVFNGRLYFAADDGGGAHGKELWTSDGTQEGTYMVRDLFPGHFRQAGITYPNSSDPHYCTPCGDLLYFTAIDGYRRELWATDGTAAGTRRVLNISKPDASPIVASGSNLYFRGSTASHGVEPWVWDGEDVRMLADILPGPADSMPRNITPYENDVIFVASNRYQPFSTLLWPAVYRSDGTEAGTQPIQPLTSFGTTFGDFVAYGTSLVFSAAYSNGVELWTTDGTITGTRMVRDINPGTGNALPNHLHELGGILYFSATDGVSGTELWRTDGTSNGTWRVADLNPGSASSSPFRLTSFGDDLYFVATTPGIGDELHRYNPQSNEVTLVRDIRTGTLSGGVHSLTPYLDRLIFSANNGVVGSEPWITDGSEAGTVLLKDIAPGSGGSTPQMFTEAGGRLFFRATGPQSTELWKTDGTEDGTELVKNLRRQNIHQGFQQASNPDQFIVVNGLLFFTAYNDDVGRELWRSDGTPLGTLMVKDIMPGNLSSMVRDLTPLGNRLFFTANDGTHGRELWVTDGTYDGTMMVEDLLPGPASSSPSSLTVHNGALYYFADDGSDDLTLRRYVPTGLTAFEAWLDEVAPHLAGDDRLASADPDGDGKSNIVEYDMNSNPGVADGGDHVVMTLHRPGPYLAIGSTPEDPVYLTEGSMFEFSYLRRVNFRDRGLWYKIESSATLHNQFQNWQQELPRYVTVIDLGDGWELVTFQLGAINLGSGGNPPSHPPRMYYRKVLETDIP